ncbi:MAG: hypothetical protein J7647_16925 [Cyanobacteria bacterium SBLK]|nr:hypothetical protein [Cyanobacteria bacterium SBLK]
MNRLEFFRNKMAAFAGSANPQEALDRGYYVQQPRGAIADTLADRLALRPNSVHLLVGTVGSGKTTQLLVARDRLNEIEDIHAVYVDVSLYAPFAEMKPGTLLAIVGLALAQLFKDENNRETQKNIRLINNLVYGYIEYRPIPQDSTSDTNTYPLGIPRPDPLRPAVKTEPIEHEGILNPKSDNNQKYNQLVQAINMLYETAKKDYIQIVLLLDSLDRLSNPETFSKLVTTDMQTISRIGIGSVLASPLGIVYSSYRDRFESITHYQPCFNTVNNGESIAFFIQILKTRSSDDFIEKSAIFSLIYYSGGVLRDLINLTQSAIEEVYITGEETLQEHHVQTVADSFGQTQLLGVTDEEMKILKQVAETGQFLLRTEKDVRLLVSCRILEYWKPKKRYAVHPTLEPLIHQVKVEN